MKKIILGFTLFVAAFSLPSLAADWENGKHYTELSKPVLIGKTGQTEVVEFFYYGCPHCYRAQPYVHNWLKLKPANVQFFRVPVAFSKNWEWSAKLYHSAETLGVTDKVHPLIFKTHHGGKPISSIADMIAIFKQAGVSQKQFESTYNSFITNSLVNKSQKMVDSVNLKAVPAFLVNGKYLTNVPDAGGHTQLIKLINWLIKNNP